MQRFFLALMISFFITSLNAQEIAAEFGIGNIIRHRESLAFSQPNIVSTLQISYSPKPKNYDWKKFWKYPEFNHHIHFTHFGNNAELGYAFGYLPSLKFKLLSKKTWSFYFAAGSGLAYINKPFDRINNPANNAISTIINNVTQFSFENQIAFSSQLKASLGLSMFHYSNGAMKVPNSGINTYLISIGIKYAYQEKINFTDQEIIKTQRPNRKIDMMTGLGFRQINIDGSPTYLIPHVSISYRINILPFYKVNTGILYEYDNSVYQFRLHQFGTKQEAKREARNLNIIIDNDLIFGDFFARISLSYRLPKATDDFDDFLYYHLGLFYYLPLKKQNFYLGVKVKTSNFVAYYLPIQIGYQF